MRVLGEELRAEIETLGRLVTIETGKLLSEGYGEVQEMIDICGFAAGLSRQLAGLTIASERANHRMMETWHPLGVVGVISAFNFPVAVWSWNAALALVCGNAVVWKPSEKTPLTALATHALFERAAAKVGNIPVGLSALLLEMRGWARCWWTMRGFRWCRRQDRRRWGERLGRDWQNGLRDRFWSLAETMRLSCVRALILILRCGRLRFQRWERRASAAHRCGG